MWSHASILTKVLGNLLANDSNPALLYNAEKLFNSVHKIGSCTVYSVYNRQGLVKWSHIPADYFVKVNKIVLICCSSLLVFVQVSNWKSSHPFLWPINPPMSTQRKCKSVLKTRLRLWRTSLPPQKKTGSWKSDTATNRRALYAGKSGGTNQCVGSRSRHWWVLSGWLYKTVAGHCRVTTSNRSSVARNPAPRWSVALCFKASGCHAGTRVVV